ncbi:hypothetical protein BJ165DRAFT_628891 [Panaeolus papilionaceus]|nr:hypothetical protein BJ165DRAFT_628891 [Panaeolus papilionaceus]
MSYLRVIALLTCLVAYTDATTITLYRAQAPLPTPSGRSIEQAGTTVYSALGPGESGMTRYEVQDIRSRFVIHDQEGTATILDELTTVLTYTIQQGASAIHEDYPPLMIWPTAAPGLYLEIGIDADCVLASEGGDVNAVCTGERLVPLLADKSGPTSVPSPQATTYTVKATPVATITVDGADGGSGKTGGAMRTRGAVGVGMGAMGVCMGAVMGVLGVVL